MYQILNGSMKKNGNSGNFRLLLVRHIKESLDNVRILKQQLLKKFARNDAEKREALKL